MRQRSLSPACSDLRVIVEHFDDGAFCFLNASVGGAAKAKAAGQTHGADGGKRAGYAAGHAARRCIVDNDDLRCCGGVTRHRLQAGPQQLWTIVARNDDGQARGHARVPRVGRCA